MSTVQSGIRVARWAAALSPLLVLGALSSANTVLADTDQAVERRAGADRDADRSRLQGDLQRMTRELERAAREMALTATRAHAHGWQDSEAHREAAADFRRRMHELRDEIREEVRESVRHAHFSREEVRRLRDDARAEARASVSGWHAERDEIRRTVREAMRTVRDELREVTREIRRAMREYSYRRGSI